MIIIIYLIILSIASHPHPKLDLVLIAPIGFEPKSLIRVRTFSLKLCLQGRWDVIGTFLRVYLSVQSGH